MTSFGAPQRLRSDCGTENTVCAGIMCFIYQDTNAHLYGKSTANQRIEALWSKMRSTILPWIDFFQSMASENLLVIGNTLHMRICRYCFSHLIQDCITQFMMYWNNHHVRKSSECPAGKPDILYFTGENKGRTVTQDTIAEISTYCLRNMPLTGCEGFDGYCHDIRCANELALPVNKQEAKSLYSRILEACNARDF